MMVCFDRMLASEWYRIAQCIRELANKNIGGVTLWNFLDFLVTQRTPLFILLLLPSGNTVFTKVLPLGPHAKKGVYIYLSSILT